jgi:hypothetical protein
MDVGELVTVVCAFPGVSSLCAFGCQSGRLGVFDSESNRLSFNGRQANSIFAMTVADDSILYAADVQRVYRYDTRSSGEPTVQFEAKSEIRDIAVQGTSICAVTRRHGIVVSDGRHLERRISEEKVNSSPPTRCALTDKTSLLCGYDDGGLVMWHALTEENHELEVPTLLMARKLPPLGIASFSNVYAVGYESGISIYRDGKLLEHTAFGQRGRFGPMAYAPCFGTDYVIAVLDESSLLPCRIGGGPGPMKTLHGSAISSISANYLMVCIAEDDDEGYIGAVMPESFGEEFL